VELVKQTETHVREVCSTLYRSLVSDVQESCLHQRIAVSVNRIVNNVNSNTLHNNHNTNNRCLSCATSNVELNLGQKTKTMVREVVSSDVMYVCCRRESHVCHRFVL
jgi:hypothetical protein